MGLACTKMDTSSIDEHMANLPSVYVPLESLTEPTVRSIISVAIEFPNWDFSQRTLLIFLLAINEKLEEIENSTDENKHKFDEHLIQHAKKVREWLVDDKNKPLNWDRYRQSYHHIAKLKCNDLAHYYGSKDANPYFELKMKTVSYL
jgi:hypothetical protein